MVISGHAAKVTRDAKPRLASRVTLLLNPLAKAAVVSLFVIIITFVLGRLVLSDPGRMVLGNTATQQAVDAYNSALGLDRPPIVQLTQYLLGLLRGDLGSSYAYSGTPVWNIVAPGLQISATLALTTAVVSLVAATVLGLTAATTRRYAVDYTIRATSLVSLSMPTPFVGIMLILLLAVTWHILPAGGWRNNPPETFAYLVLPVLSLSAYLTPILLRVVRERALVVLGEAHIEAASTRGVSRARVLFAHVLPNSVSPLLTVLAFNIGGLLSGAVIAEVLFGIPGLGRILATAAANGDIPVLQGVALLAGVLVTLCNLAAEIAQRLIDPRLRS